MLQIEYKDDYLLLNQMVNDVLCTDPHSGYLPLWETYFECIQKKDFQTVNIKMFIFLFSDRHVYFYVVKQNTPFISVFIV